MPALLPWVLSSRQPRFALAPERTSEHTAGVGPGNLAYPRPLRGEFVPVRKDDSLKNSKTLNAKIKWASSARMCGFTPHTKVRILRRRLCRNFPSVRSIRRAGETPNLNSTITGATTAWLVRNALQSAGLIGSERARVPGLLHEPSGAGEAGAYRLH